MTAKLLTREDIGTANKDWPAFEKQLALSIQADDTGNQLTDVKFDVHYDELGHDWWLTYTVGVKDPSAEILQVWVKDYHPGIWIPELRPWVQGVCEFDAGTGVRKFRGGVIDSKWRAEDVGQEYFATLWGYVGRGGSVFQFGPVQKRFTHPGASKGAAMFAEARERTADEPGLRSAGPKIEFGDLTVFSGRNGNNGIRATAALSAAWPSSSWMIWVHFCDAAKMLQVTDDVGGPVGAPWNFHVPVELMPFVVPILRSEPKKFITYMWSNPSGTGTPIGKIGYLG